METPWTNKKKMEEIIAMQSNKYMRFPIKKIVTESVCEIEENIESNSGKREKQSKQPRDSKKNIKQQKRNKRVKNKKRQNPIQENIVIRDDEVNNAQYNQPTSSKKNLSFQSIELFSFQKPLSYAKEVSLNRGTDNHANENACQVTFTQSAVSKDDFSTKPKSEYEETDLKPNLLTQQLQDIINEKTLINPETLSDIVSLDEEHIPFSEENALITLDQKPSLHQFVAGTGETDIAGDFPIQEIQHTSMDEEQIPVFDENAIITLFQKPSLLQFIAGTGETDIARDVSIQENQPASTNEEQSPVSDENITAAIEEEPSLFHQTKDIAEGTIVEDPPIDTTVEMKYDQTTFPYLEESVQEDILHDGTASGKENDPAKPLQDKKSNFQKEDQSKDLCGTNEIYANNTINTNDFLNIWANVIVGKYNIEICLEDEEIFAEKVKEIREIYKKVELTTCEFVPSELSPVLDNGSCKALKGNLMIEGLIHQDIKYIFENKQPSNDIQNQPAFNQTNHKNLRNLRKLNFGRYSYVPQPYPVKNPNPSFELQTNHGQYYERFINSMSKTIPFSSVIEINHFLHPPLFGSNEEKSFVFQSNHIGETTQFTTTTYYPENTHGKLISSKIHENVNLLKYEEKYIKNPRIKLKQFIVLELLIHLLQEQSVQIQSPQNGFNL